MLQQYTCSTQFPHALKSTCYLNVDETGKCPICKVAIKPVFLYGLVHCELTDLSDLKADVVCFCESCKRSFISHFKNIKPNSAEEFDAWECEYSAPNEHKKREFEDSLQSLSPKFCKIYNQSSQAEHENLLEISGMGYRKALEFLVKDYAIKTNPDAKTKIETQPLAQCIKDYIENPKIKELATKSVWLANDETHYIRKHKDYSVQDFKNLIEALVYFILMHLTLEKSSDITPQ